MKKKQQTHPVQKCHHFPEVGVPFFWPLGIAYQMETNALEFEKKNMEFLTEVIKTEIQKPKPIWATPNKEIYSLHCFTLRDFSKKDATEIPVLVLSPYAGHSSIIADFNKKQSLVEALKKHGINRLFVTDWHSATEEMKDYDIDNYLEELEVAVNDLGGKVHLIGLCQGGWMASLFAARFPDKVMSLVIAGSPIDTQAGNGAIGAYAKKLPMAFFEEMVASGGGLLRGAYMLEGFKSLHPQEQFLEKYIELYDKIDDPEYINHTENFERWYEYTIDLPGRWYLQAVKQLFKDNLFVKGKFTALGKVLDPKTIKCPLYLLAGDSDDITPKEQVFNAENYFGTPKKNIVKSLAKGGHIGLFMGSKALNVNWPEICAWLVKQMGDSRK